MTQFRPTRRALLGTGATLLAAAAIRPAHAAEKQVTFAYQDMVVPFRVLMETEALQKATGYTINWRKFGGGGDGCGPWRRATWRLGQPGPARSRRPRRRVWTSSCSGSSTISAMRSNSSRGTAPGSGRIEFYRPLPPLAYLPLMVIWFGIGETAKVMLIFLACFAPVALATRSGVLSASRDQINAALSMGASRLQVMLHVVLPAATPEILVGLRIGMGVGWTTLVAAEMVAANAGLGQMVLSASNFLRTDVVVMGILVIGFFAILFEVLMRWLERMLVPWKGMG